MNRKNSIQKFLVGVLATSLLLSGCSKQTPSNNAVQTILPGQKIQVVAAENFYGEIATAVGGDHVEVTSIINNPDADPHDFEPTAETSRLINRANLVIYNGIGYDDWMTKLLKSNSTAKSKSTISVGSDLLGKKEGDNPHVWYDPTAMPKLADALAEKLAKIDPGQADTYRKRAQDYKASLAPFLDLIASIASLKQPGELSIAVSEPVFEYMSNALHFTIVNPRFAKSIAEGTDPAPKDLADLQRAITDKKIQIFVVNKQTESPVVKNVVDLAIANQIKVVEVTETEPVGKNYMQWMTDQLKQIQAAPGNK